MHTLLIAGCLLELLNSLNVVIFHFKEDAVTYGLTALVYGLAALSQILSRPLNTARPLRWRWMLWAAFLLVKGVGFSWCFVSDFGIADISRTACLFLFSASYSLAYLTVINPPARRNHWPLDTSIAIILGAIFFLVEVHTEGDRANGRLIFITALQAVFATAAMLARAASTKLVERRLATRMFVYFSVSFVMCAISSAASICPWLPGARFASVAFTLDVLALLAVTVLQISGSQQQPTLAKKLPGSVTIVITAVILLACVPLLHWHLNLGIALIIVAIGLFAVRLSLIQNQLDQERDSFERGNRTLRELASTDSLTGIANRRCFMEALTRSVTRVQQGEGSFLLAIFDLDNLKQINDFQGHLAGDECIKEFAETVARTVAPPFDHFARLGGDEFTLLLIDSDINDCRTTVQEVRLALAGTQIRFSVGVAACDSASPLSPTELLGEADANLYRAKRSSEVSRQA